MLCEISKGTFEISHKILNPYTAFSLTFIFVYDLRYLWIVTSQASVRWTPGYRSAVGGTVIITKQMAYVFLFKVHYDCGNTVMTYSIAITLMSHHNLMHSFAPRKDKNPFVRDAEKLVVFCHGHVIAPIILYWVHFFQLMP